MISESAIETAPCPACGGTLEVASTQVLLPDGTLRWDVTRSCPQCGSVTHEGGPGPMPDELRQSLLRANGPTSLRIPAPVGVSVMRVLRTTFDLSLPQAKQMAERAGREGLTGTRPEMEQLAERLRAIGVKAETSPAP